MNKEKLIQLRKKVHDLFFKKSYQKERSLDWKEFHGTSL